MKYYLFVHIACIALFIVGCGAHPVFPYLYPYPIAKFTLHVVNQDNNPVPDTAIEASFAYCNHDLCKRTDENGYVTFESPAVTDVLFTNRPHEEYKGKTPIKPYYHTTIRKKFHTPSKNTKDGKWQPWNPTLKMVLKEKINPIPMYVSGCAFTIHGIKIPIRNKWIGFDMEKNEWTFPYGNGEYADIKVFHQWDGINGESYSGSTIKIHFPDVLAGVYDFHYDVDSHGNYQCLKSPHHANPTTQYNPDIAFEETIFFKKDSVIDKVYRRINQTHMPLGIGYVFRTRTQVDEQGHLITARYGKIYPSPEGKLFTLTKDGECHFNLCYYMNPIANDTNLEFDPEKNLLKTRQKYTP